MPSIRTALKNINLRSFSSGKSTVSSQEVKKFAQASQEWWDPHGQFSMLHRMNPVRVEYIRNQIQKFATHGIDHLYPLKDLRVLDIGCGGGLLSESLKRLGANVVAVDAASENIQMAMFHKSFDESLENAPGSLEYRASLAESLVEQGEKFNVVCGLEIVEHVADRGHFLKSCAELTTENGLLFFSTINKTLLSKFLTIDLAETVLGMVPQGTHDYEKYVTPEAMTNDLALFGCQVADISGMLFNPLTKTWSIHQDKSVNIPLVNYILVAQKS